MVMVSLDSSSKVFKFFMGVRRPKTAKVAIPKMYLFNSHVFQHYMYIFTERV